MKFIIDQLQNYASLSPHTVQLIEKQITQKTLKKGTVIRSNDDQPKQMYFIQEGLVKLKLSKRRITRTHFVNASNTSFIHFGIFHHSNEIKLELKALEELVVYSIPYSFFEILSYENKEFNKLYTRMVCLDEFIYSHEYSAYKNVNLKDSENRNTFFRTLQKVAAVFL